jgi:hypothetical protein
VSKDPHEVTIISGPEPFTDFDHLKPKEEEPGRIFDIKGKPTRVSREYVRAWLHASLSVLEYHNLHLGGPVTVRFVPQSKLGKLHVKGREDEPAAGYWQASTRTIAIKRDSSREGMATHILHELVHACAGDFDMHEGDDTDEHCCSTLTAKLKPTVAKLADILLDGTYQRAAFVAHTKMAYRVQEDRYNSAQHERVGVRDKYGPKPTHPQPPGKFLRRIRELRKLEKKKRSA